MRGWTAGLWSGRRGPPPARRVRSRHQCRGGRGADGGSRPSPARPRGHPGSRAGQGPVTGPNREFGAEHGGARPAPGAARGRGPGPPRPGPGRIAAGNPKTVPAGQYAAESLRALGLWDKLQPRIVFAENVRQALDYVSRGEVDAGFVYTTDAATRPGRVREAFRPAQDTYGPILYPVAVLRDAGEPALADAFLDRLVGPAGHAVLKRFGFEPPPAAARR